MREDVNVGQVLTTSVRRRSDESRPLDSETVLTVERRVQGLACDAQQLSASLTRLQAGPHHPGLISSEPLLSQVPLGALESLT